MGIHIRRVGIEEIDLLMAWRMEVLREVFSIAPERSLAGLEAANRRYYEEELPSEGHIACLASANGEVVGCGGICLTRELPSPDNPTGACAYLMNVYVRPSKRGRGAGSAIVRWLVGEAKARKIPKIYLETTPKGRGVYGAAGFTDMPDMMRIPLGGDRV